MLTLAEANEWSYRVLIMTFGTQSVGGRPIFDAVRASYARCLRVPRFLHMFYDEFFSRDPRIQEKFVLTDFDRQVEVLESSIMMMIHLALDPADARTILAHLAKRHAKKDLDIAPELYDVWLDALIHVISVSDPDFTTELRDQWRTALAPGIAYFKSQYDI